MNVEQINLIFESFFNLSLERCLIVIVLIALMLVGYALHVVCLSINNVGR